MTKRTKRHYRDIIQPYKDWDYQLWRERLRECLPYLIWKYCNKKYLRINENEYGWVMLYVDQRMMSGKYNIDTIVQNAVNDCLLYTWPISLTLRGVQHNNITVLPWDYNESDVESDWRDLWSEYYWDQSFKLGEIKWAMMNLSKEERSVMEARYLRDKPLQPYCIAKYFWFTRRKTARLLKNGVAKIREALANMITDDKD